MPRLTDESREAPPPRLAYVDTSAVMAIALEEPAAPHIARRLFSFVRLVSSNLLEAEARAAFHREGMAFDAGTFANITWVHPTRSLGPEIAKALEVGGYLRGADLWHVATALYVDATVIGGISFITLDNRQRTVASNLGFAT